MPINNKQLAEFSSAIIKGNTELMTAMLAEFKNLANEKFLNAPFLHSALTKKNLEVVKLLLDNGAEVNFDAFRHAIKSGCSLQMIELLFEKEKSCLKVQHPKLGTLLHAAVEKFSDCKGLNKENDQKNVEEIIGFLLRQGIDRDAENNIGKKAIELTSDREIKKLIDPDFIATEDSQPKPVPASIKVAAAPTMTIAEQLRKAIKENNFEEAKKLIPSLKTAEEKDEFLESAVKSRSIELVQELINIGARVNLGEGMPLIWATEKDDQEMVIFLLKNHADLSRQEFSALRIAVEKGNEEMVKSLLSNKGNFKQSLDNPFEAALKKGNIEILELFFNNLGNCTIDFGKHFVSHEDCSSETYTYLVEKAIALKYYIYKDLKVIIDSCNLEAIKLLVKNGDFIKSQGGVALTHAVLQYLDNQMDEKHLNVVEFLLEKGVSINKCDQVGNSCAHLAIPYISTKKNYEAIKTFIKEYLGSNGFDFTAQNTAGETIIDIAAKYHDIGIEYFLELYASAGKKCESALLTQALRNTIPVHNLQGAITLIKHGADVNILDSSAIKSLMRDPNNYRDGGKIHYLDQETLRNFILRLVCKGINLSEIKLDFMLDSEKLGEISKNMLPNFLKNFFEPLKEFISKINYSILHEEKIEAENNFLTTIGIHRYIKNRFGEDTLNKIVLKGIEYEALTFSDSAEMSFSPVLKCTWTSQHIEPNLIGDQLTLVETISNN